MQERDETRIPADEELSLLDLLRWISRWWWLVLCGALAGIALGLFYHLAVQERFTVRLDLTVTETPVGAGPIVQEIATNFLRKQAGASVAVDVNARTQIVSLIERDIPPDAVAARQAAIHSAVAALAAFLKDMAVREYALMQEHFAPMEQTPEVYAALSRYRFYLAAVEDGLIEPAAVVSESAQARGPSLVALLLMGAFAGSICAAAAALATDALRRMRLQAGR